MKRHFAFPHRFALQLGLLTGIAVAFIVGTHEASLRAEGPDCPVEGECTFLRPNIMLVVDYSTAMNGAWGGQDDLTRWQVAVDSITTMTQAGSFLSQNTHLALMRFGHDPEPAQVGTVIPGDASGLVDGQVLDVPWSEGPNEPWLTCNGPAIAAALEAAGPPLAGSLVGIDAWTRGALESAREQIEQSIADHPADAGERAHLVVVVTRGAWTDAAGTQVFGPPEQSPVPVAAALLDELGVSTYVISVADAPAPAQSADALAVAGGTGPSALAADDPIAIQQALGGFVQGIVDAIVAPDCVSGAPRIMVLLDASSSMLNVEGGTQAGGPGTTGWDIARAALASGGDSLFDVELAAAPGFAAEDALHFGLAVFGDAAPAPGEQKLLVQYGLCQQDNFAWALAPTSSCKLPGCDDPWGGPPISWTFVDGSMIDPPGFGVSTLSHMPRCGGDAAFCAGSGGAVHLGLELVRDNQLAYVESCSQQGAEPPCDANTPFVNILITDGSYLGHSTDAQVQTPLEQMFAAGITTYVIGLGEGADTPAALAQLDAMASWGSGAALEPIAAAGQVELEQALAGIVESLELELHPCCALEDCTAIVKPTTGEPDPVPSDETLDTGLETTQGDTEGSATSSETSSSGTTSDSQGENADEVAGDGTTSGTSGLDDEAGCSCATSEPGRSRGVAGTLLLLGLAGVARRRRG